MAFKKKVEDAADAEANLKHVAFWSDTSNGETAQPGLRKFYNKEQVILHLESRLKGLDGIYMRTTSAYRIESARVMREALTKMIRRLKKETNWAQYEEKPINISGSLHEYCKAKRMDTPDIKKAQPAPPAQVQNVPDFSLLDPEGIANNGVLEE